MANVVLSFPELSNILVYQSAAVVLGLLGAFFCYMIVRTVLDDEWRKVSLHFVKALVLFSMLEFAELTDVYWNYDLITLITETFVITYIVYGVYRLRLLIRRQN